MLYFEQDVPKVRNKSIFHSLFLANFSMYAEAGYIFSHHTIFLSLHFNFKK